MGAYRTHWLATRSAVRALDAAHECLPIGKGLGTSPCRPEGSQLPLTPEPPL